MPEVINIPRKQPAERFSLIQIVNGETKRTIRDNESGKCIGLYERDNDDQYQVLALLNEIAKSDFFDLKSLQNTLRIYKEEIGELREKLKLMGKEPELTEENRRLKIHTAELERNVASLTKQLEAANMNLAVKELFPENTAETKARDTA